MICPLDQNPCTGDQSKDCYRQCMIQHKNERRLPEMCSHCGAPVHDPVKCHACGRRR